MNFLYIFYHENYRGLVGLITRSFGTDLKRAANYQVHH
ncbi:hypothetical protein BN1221_02313 [Brenneria goodwinii]|uniref:Uncharacterized protein n=1 Tax=Brenneria goodwinii TaxID=1109412 RepID=A0A0G4JVV8_9GAMM|nr:hypothetical protein BN1221_02313 [Brenneria goodwinii]